jgi:tetratricopeptide (TPR) repeat protein
MLRTLLTIAIFSASSAVLLAQDTLADPVQKRTMSELYESIRKDSANAQAWYELAEMNTELHDFEEAMQNYNKVIELQPKNAMAFKNRGRLKAYLQDFRGSIIDFTIAIELDKKLSDAYFDRGLSRYFIKQYAGAVEDFDMVLKWDAADHVAWFNRGRALIGLGMKDEGCLSLSKAGELGFFGAYDWIRNNCN